MTNHYENHEREVAFLERMKRVGVHAVRFEGAFKLPSGLSYSPDFYIPATDTYVEVVGTRQAFKFNQHKYVELMLTGCLNIWFVTWDLKPLFPHKLARMLVHQHPCAVPGCKAPAVYIKRQDIYCTRHGRQMRMTGSPVPIKKAKPCSVEGCHSVAKARGFCPKHYYSVYQKEHKKISPIPCSICGNPSYAKGLCARHYHADYRHRLHPDAKRRPERKDRAVVEKYRYDPLDSVVRLEAK